MLDQAALAGKDLGREFAAVLGRHHPLHALDDRQDRAPVVLELLGAIADVDPRPPAGSSPMHWRGSSRYRPIGPRKKSLMGWTGVGERTVEALAGWSARPGRRLPPCSDAGIRGGLSAPSWRLAVGVTGLRCPPLPGRRTTPRSLPRVSGPLTRVPEGWRGSGSLPRTRMTVIMTVFVTVMMTVISPVRRRVPKARAASVGRGFLMRWDRAGAWRQPRSWSAGVSPRRRTTATSLSSRRAV